MAKKVKTTLKLNLPAGEATPAPPVGPALGQHGVAIMDFCKAYNEATQDRKGTIIPAVITIYEDRSFNFVTKTPPASTLLLEVIGAEKGAAKPPGEKVGKISKERLRRIAEQKLQDLNTQNLEEALKIITGTARSMGIEVEE